jgi:hypothetical protein
MSDPNAIILGYAKIWTAPYGEAFPSAAIGFGVAWGGNWAYLGDTTEPLTFGGTRNTFQVEIQQSTSVIKEIITKDERNFKTSLAEHNATALNQLLLGTLVNVQTGGSPYYYAIDFGGNAIPNVLSVGFEAVYQLAAGTQYPLRWMFYRGSIMQDGDIKYDKAGVASIPINITTFVDTTKAAGKQLGRYQAVYG